MFLRRASVPRSGQPFDGWGFLLSSLAFGCTLYGLSQVRSHGWSSLEVHRPREARINTLRNSMIEMLQEYGIVRPDISPQVGFFLTDRFFPRTSPIWSARRTCWQRPSKGAFGLNDSAPECAVRPRAHTIARR
jgi:hypothetical protein